MPMRLPGQQDWFTKNLYGSAVPYAERPLSLLLLPGHQEADMLRTLIESPEERQRHRAACGERVERR